MSVMTLIQKGKHYSSYKEIKERMTDIFNSPACSTMFIAAAFIIARSWKKPDVLQQRNGYRNCGTFAQWSTTQLLKTMNS